MGRISKAALRCAVGISLVMSAPGVAAAAAPPPSGGSDAYLEQFRRVLLTEPEMPKGYTFESLIIAVHGGMAEPGDPCAEASPGSTTLAGEMYGPMASISFQKGTDGPTVSESITSTGAKAAAESIARYEKILNSCPVAGDETFKLSYARWPIPKFGDASIGYVLTMGGTDDTALRFRTAMVAYGDVLATITNMESGAENGADLKNVVRAAVKKLEKAK